MSSVPAELKYVDTHEWLRQEDDGTITIGITDHAQALLGDIVFVELPQVGAQLAAGDTAGVVESVKAASDVYAPIAGEVVAINEALVNEPELANTEPYGDAWFFRVRPLDADALAGALDAAGYVELIGA